MISYVKEFGFDKENVTIINALIGKEEYGRFIDFIYRYLEQDDNWDEYRRILSEESIDDNSKKFEK